VPGWKRPVSVPLDASQQQVVFDRQATDQRAIGFMAAQFAGRKHFANLQTASGPTDDS